MNRMSALMRSTGEGRKKNGFLKYTVAIVLIMVLVAGFVLTTYSDNLNEGLSENLIRLHVLANSDSEEDQALKRDVRDVVLKYMREKLENSDERNKAKNIILNDIDKIKEIARKEIVRQGKNYNVTATLGNFPFPTKAYGDIALPAGYYEALRIVIGKGEGANWWCVLFPPLCFVDATHGTVPEDVKEKLKKSLSEEEYNILTTSDSDDVPVKVKFKLLEVIQGSKIKFSGAIKKLFSFI